MAFNPKTLTQINQKTQDRGQELDGNGEKDLQEYVREQLNDFVNKKRGYTLLLGEPYGNSDAIRSSWFNSNSDTPNWSEGYQEWMLGGKRPDFIFGKKAPRSVGYEYIIWELKKAWKHNKKFRYCIGEDNYKCEDERVVPKTDQDYDGRRFYKIVEDSDLVYLKCRAEVQAEEYADLLREAVDEDSQIFIRSVVFVLPEKRENVIEEVQFGEFKNVT